MKTLNMHSHKKHTIHKMNFLISIFGEPKFISRA